MKEKRFKKIFLLHQSLQKLQASKDAFNLNPSMSTSSSRSYPKDAIDSSDATNNHILLNKNNANIGTILPTVASRSTATTTERTAAITTTTKTPTSIISRTLTYSKRTFFVFLALFLISVLINVLSVNSNGSIPDTSREVSDSPLSSSSSTTSSSSSSSKCPKHSSPNSTTNDLCCADGLVIRAWRPLKNVSTGDVIARGLIYFFALVYLFVGVSIIADRFMAAIEVITSQERDVTIKLPNNEKQVISVRIWNETVSNLTLMALGSSAPEILLSIIEIFSQNFQAGDLGPGTIVGSAAFNMFVIIAICVWVVPSTETKKIKHLRVFFITMIWSVFAYVWLLAILAWISRDVVEIWEAVLTFAFFPATVLTAYIADRRLLIYKYLSKQYRMNKRGVVVATEGPDSEDMEMGMTKMGNHLSDGGLKVFEEEVNDEVKEFEEHRREFINILRELRKKHPDAPIEEIELMAREEAFNRGPKSRAFYRLQATKKLTGGATPFKRRPEKFEEKKEEVEKKKDENVVQISFDPAHYTVLENVGKFAVTITREGDLNLAVAVDFKTEDGTANAGSDFEGVDETIIFRPGEAHKQVYITVIDDDVFEEDEHFYCRLSNPRYIHSEDQRNGGPGAPLVPELKLGTPAIATVMILDDDHGGVFAFSEAQFEVSEAIGQYLLPIMRYSGARGRVHLPYRILEGTAKYEVDYVAVSGQVIFENNESLAEIPIQIIDNESYEKDAVLYVELMDPVRDEDMEENDESPKSELSNEEKVALLGKPRLGEITRCQIRIKESKEFKNTVDKLFQKANTSFVVGASSWKDQFIEAITVSAGDDDGGGDDEDGEMKMPSWSDYVMHFITLFWKVIFAFVPPTDYMDGWVCFVVSIIGIGVLTALIGDLAAHLGCTCGIHDTVTAIAFVALGTSVPDTFASKVAAQNDKYADSSIGNVTGSNAVNVFLGIGIAWTIAAVYNAINGQTFKVEPRDLGFSVFLFCVCALFCCAVLLVRRYTLGGELGGRMLWKALTAACFVGLWLLYVLVSTLKTYHVIEGFEV